MPYNSRTSFRGKSNFRKPNRTSRPSGPKRGVYIDPARFIKVATPAEDVIYEAKHTFADFDINPLLKNNLAGSGYITPTPIQDQAIPAALLGKDVVGVANTGTGKTAAFGVPILNRLLSERNSRVLVIAPTRELAQQIEAENRKIARGSGISGAVLIGGSSMSAQLRDLRSRPQIVIGTPGRIKDHAERGSIRLDAFNIVVLDEVDRMLDMGFINDIRTIFNQTAEQRQSFFFSATLSPEVSHLIDGFARDAVTISVRSGTSNDSINQDVIRYGSPSDKLDKLHEALLSSEKVIIFDETQRNVERLGKELMIRGFKADSIHGGKSQGQRQRALKRFKDNEVNVLVATNVAARGIDVIDVTHVINYSLPQTYDDYIHRIGRAGRAGRIGHALTFVAS
jgi:ATP-dependent RNA helicase RhlE